MSGQPRIFVPSSQVGERAVRLDGDRLHHLRRVMRLKAGEDFLATDGEGMEYSLRLVSTGGELQGEILDRRRPATESPLRVVLAQAVAKGDVMGRLLQKAVELGVAEIVPIVTSRTVGAGEEVRRRRRERWARIVEGAVAQSGRTVMPKIAEVRSWKELLKEDRPRDLKIILWEQGGRGLEEWACRNERPTSILLAAGPEGGWREEEIELGQRAGFEPLRMGPRILRTATASLAALSVLQFLYGDLGGDGEGRKASAEDGKDI